MRIGKGMRGGGDQENVTRAIRVRIEKNEERYYLALAHSRRLIGRDGKPSLAKALVYAARVGLNCWAEHTTHYQKPHRASRQALQQANLSVTKDPARGAGQIKTITKVGKGRYRVEYDTNEDY